MNGFEKVTIKIEKEMLSRLQKISEVLNISLDKVINASLVDGVLPYWLSYQQILTEISNKEGSITEEDYQDAVDTLTSEIDSDFEDIQGFTAYESEFESLYPFGHFTDLHKRRTHFITFLRSRREVKEILEEEVPEPQPLEKKTIKPPLDTESDKEDEGEAIPPSLFSRISSYVKDQVNSKITDFKDVIFHGKFLGILVFLNFFIFYDIYLIWPSMFDFMFMLETYPLWQSLLSMLAIIVLIPIMFIITGFIGGKFYYYIVQKRRFIFSVTHIMFPFRNFLYLGSKSTGVIFSKIRSNLFPKS